jgi:peroxiredoxin
MVKEGRSSFIAAALSVLMLISSGLILPMASPAESQAATNFSLKGLDGSTVSSANTRGKVVVFAFGATWLPLSRDQLQALRQLANDYSDRGVLIYWVSTDSDSPKSRNYASDEQVKAFFTRQGINLPVLRDPDARVSRQLGVDQLPAIVILDKSGAVAGRPIGGLDPQRNLAAVVGPRLDALLAK